MTPNQINKQIEAYRILFEIENSLRVGMHNSLVKKIGINYFGKNNFPNFEYDLDGQKIQFDTIKVVNEAISKKNSEPKYKKKLGFEYPYLWYLDLLQIIMILDNFWKIYFNDLFSSPKSIKSEIIQRAIKLSKTRNNIAHNRYISDIEFNDLKSFHQILMSSINVELLSNYDEMVFNKLELLKSNFHIYTQEILSLISKGQIITRKKLRDWKYLYSAIENFNENANKVILFEEIFNLLNEYDQTLPRKPGRMKEILDFTKKHKIVEKISSLFSQDY